MMTPLHRLWRRLPHKLRRGVFDRASLMAAPNAGPAPCVPVNSPICVVGAFQAPTGLGEAARLTANGLHRAGYETQLFDVTDLLRQPRTVSPPNLPLMTQGPGIVLVFGNPPVTSFALAHIGRKMLAGKFRVGCWVWEYPTLPEAWVPHARRFHLMAAPNQFVVDAIRTSISDVDVGLLPYPMDPDSFHSVSSRRRDPGRFCIGFIFDVTNDTGRKNPEAIIQAVSRAFPNDQSVEVAFTVATGTADHPRLASLASLATRHGVRLTFDFEAKTRSRHLARFDRIDVYMSLHRAEGFGLTLAEAVQCGVPVVATRALPVTEYLNDANSYLVDATVAEAPATVDTASPGLWHEVDIDMAAAQLVSLRGDWTSAQARAVRAQHDLLRLYGPDGFAACAQAITRRAWS